MNKNEYIYVYLIVYFFSFIGLIQGLTSSWIANSFLVCIFFSISFAFILLIYGSDKQNNFYQAILISFLTIIYFLVFNILSLTIPLILIVNALFIKKTTFIFDAKKSILYNFYQNLIIYEKVLIFVLFICIFYINKN
jgi:hypothetical protein